MTNFAVGMTKEELVARLRDIEWEDFEVKTAKSDLPKNIWESVSALKYLRRMDCAWCEAVRKDIRDSRG